MCGICGEFKFNTKNFSNENLNNLMDSISSRGNDSRGTYMDDDVFLGHHRLAIIDTSSKSNQPTKVGKYVIIFNGEIYNHFSIRSLLEKEFKIKWRGTSDTETLIESISYFGINKTLQIINGMFAFVLFDSNWHQQFQYLLDLFFLN